MKSRSITRYLPILLVIALALAFALALSAAPVVRAFASDVEIVMTPSSEHPYALEQILTVEDVANTYYLKVEKGTTPYNFYTEDPLQFPIGTNVMEAIEWHLYDDADCMILADAAINALVNVDYAEIDELTPLSVNWLSASPDSVGQYALVFHTGTKDTSDPDYSTLAGVRFTLCDPEAASTPQALDLVITVTDREICYGDAALAQKDYVYNVSGKDADMVGELNFENALYTCSYTQWDDAGNYTITLSGVQSDDYTFTLVPGTLTVNPKSISDLEDETITVVINDGAPYVYDGDPQTATYVITHLGHEVTYEWKVRNNDQTDAGDYDDKVIGTGNYCGERTVTWTIEKRELTIVFEGEETSYVYGDEAWAKYIADVEERNYYMGVYGLVGDDTPDDVVYAITLWDKEDIEAELSSKMKAGVYRWVVVSKENGNYAIENEENVSGDVVYYSFGDAGRVEVTRRELECNIGEIPELTYGDDGDESLTGSITLTGWADDEDKEKFPNDTIIDYYYCYFAEDIELSEINDEGWEPGLPVDAGTYYIYIVIGKGVYDDYYEPIERYVTLTIAPKALEVAFNELTDVTYGETFTQPTRDGEVNGYTVEGLIFIRDEEKMQETSCLTYTKKGETSGSTTIPTAAGEYTVTLTFEVPNYQPVCVSADFTIKQKEVTVRYAGDAVEVGYGDAVAWLALSMDFWTNYYHLTAEGLVSGDSVTGLVSAGYVDKGGNAATPGSELAVGEYSLVATDLKNSNYKVTISLGDKATLTVNEATLTAVSASQTGTLTYNGREQNASVETHATALNKKNVAFTYSATEDGEYKSTVPAFRDAGEHTVYYKATADNHKEAKGYFIVTIAKKKITVIAEDQESECGDELKELTFVGAIEAGDVVCTAATSADKDAVGEYDITLTSTNNPNYDVTLLNGKYVVKEAEDPEESSEGDTPTQPEQGGETPAEPAEKPIVLPEKAEGETPTVTETIDENEASEGGVNVTNAIESFLAAATLAGADDVDLCFEIGEEKASSVTFDLAALKALAEKGGEIKLTYKETKKEDVDQTNSAIKNAEFVIEVSLAGATFEGGKATITTAFEDKAPGGKKAVLYYVAEDGSKEKVDATFEDGKLTFVTTHFSTYIVEYELSGGSIAGIVIASVVFVGVAGFAIFWFVIKKKTFADLIAIFKKDKA